MTGEGPSMKEYREEKLQRYQAQCGDSYSWFGYDPVNEYDEGDDPVCLNEDVEKLELKIKYYKNQLTIMAERHRQAFKYLNGLYMKVLGRLRDAQSELKDTEGLLKYAVDKSVWLMDERDDARRQLCNALVDLTGNEPEYTADENGWNCFKETEKDPK